MSIARRELISWTRAAWTLVVIHGVLLTACNRGWKFHLVAAYLLAVAVSGLILRWGPAVFLPLAGFYFGIFWAPSPYLYAHNAYESMMQDIGIPVIYGVVGAAVGIFIEAMSRPRSDSPDPARPRRPLRRRGSPNA